MGAGIAANPHCPRPVRRADEGRASFLGAGSGRGLAASVGSLSGSSSGAEAPFERSQGCSTKRTSTSPLRGPSGASSLRVPRTALPKRTSAACPFRKEFLRSELLRPFPIGSQRSRSLEAILSRFLHPRVSVPLDPWRKVGSASAFASASRFFLVRARLSDFRDFPEGPPHPPFGHCRDRSSFRFREVEPLFGCPWTMGASIDSRESDLPVDNGDIGDRIRPATRRHEKARETPFRGPSRISAVFAGA